MNRFWLVAITLTMAQSAAAQGPDRLLLAGGSGGDSGGSSGMSTRLIRSALDLRGDSPEPLCMLAITNIEPMASRLRAGGRDSSSQPEDVAVAWRLGDGNARLTPTACSAIWLQNDRPGQAADTLLSNTPVTEFWQSGLPWIAQGEAAAMLGESHPPAGSTSQVRVDRSGFPVAVQSSVDQTAGFDFLSGILIEPRAWTQPRLANLLLATRSASGRLALAFDAPSRVRIDRPAEPDARLVVATGSTLLIIDLDLAIPWDSAEGFLGGFLDGRIWLLGDGDSFDFATRTAQPAKGKKSPQLNEEFLEAAAKVWQGEGFLQAIRSFALHEQIELRLGSGRGRAVLRKPANFSIQASGGDQPRAIFAGPLALDWVPTPAAAN